MKWTETKTQWCCFLFLVAGMIACWVVFGIAHHKVKQTKVMKSSCVYYQRGYNYNLDEQVCELDFMLSSGNTSSNTVACVKKLYNTQVVTCFIGCRGEKCEAYLEKEEAQNFQSGDYWYIWLGFLAAILSFCVFCTILITLMKWNAKLNGDVEMDDVFVVRPNDGTFLIN